MTQDMTGEFAAVTAVPDGAKGTSISLDMTGDDKLSNFTLNVQFMDDAVELEKVRVSISDGVIGPVINDAHAAAVVAAGNPEPGDQNYPAKPNAQAAWGAAKTKIDQLIADPACTTLEEMAESLVELLGNAGPAGQKWGRLLLKRAWKSAVQRNVG